VAQVFPTCGAATAENGDASTMKGPKKKVFPKQAIAYNFDKRGPAPLGVILLRHSFSGSGL